MITPGIWSCASASRPARQLQPLRGSESAGLASYRPGYGGGINWDGEAGLCRYAEGR